MKIVAASRELYSDEIVSAVLRSDLAPVPLTLELTVRDDPELLAMLDEGQILRAGPNLAALRIIKVKRAGEVPVVQGDKPMDVRAVIAALDSCHKVAFRRSTAVIKEGSTLAAIYRACGATAAVESDISVGRFCCFAGGVPTLQLSRLLQEECGAVLWTGTGLKFVRLWDLLKQKPIATLASDQTREEGSGFLERHEIPWFYSISEDGNIIFGNRGKTRAAVFQPRADARVLANMSRVIVQNRSMRTDYDPRVNAGAIVDVAGERLIVVTAAHVFETGTGGEGQNTYSKLWLGSLEG